MLYKVVSTFESVGEIVKCDHSHENHRAVLFGDTFKKMTSQCYLFSTFAD